jgi:hypothetical protein
VCENADLQRVGQLAVHNDHRERDAQQFQNRAHAPLPDRMDLAATQCKPLEHVHTQPDAIAAALLIREAVRQDPMAR